jgi:intracellular septation protein A
VGVGRVLKRVGLTLLISCVVPAALFYLCFANAGVGVAMAAALSWSYGALAYRAITGRAVSAMLVLTSLVLTERTVVASCAHSAFLYFVQPAISDGVLGAMFLGSLLVGRPLVARLAGDFFPLDDAQAARPAIRILFQRLSGLWAVVLLSKSVVILWLLTALPLADFVRTMSMVSPTANLATAAVTIAVGIAVARREGLLDHAPILNAELVAVG